MTKISDWMLQRRGFLAGAAALSMGGCATGMAAPGPGPAATSTPTPVNPVVRQRADAQIFRHADGLYYMTASVPEYDRLIIRRSRTIAGLADAEEAVIWRRPTSGKLGGYIWAPELHFYDDAWHMNFAAGDKDEPFRIRTYVLRCRDADPLTGRWEMLGLLQTPWDTFTLDATVFEHKGVRYWLWAQKEPGIDTNSNLYLAPMATPTTLARAPARLTVPTLPWEIRGFKVAEGPMTLNRNGRIFLPYSASATDARYCLGMLTADEDADLMRPESWSKSQEPVFVTSTETQVFGPGHHSFTVDEQGRDLLVYHGRDYEKIEGDPLFDPNRHTRVQRLYYRPDGTPDFGVPVGNGAVPDRLSPIDRPTDFLTYDQRGVSVGRGPLPNTQFRQTPGLAGRGTVSLEPILLRGQVLARGQNGEITITPRASAPPHLASFQARPGLADRSGVSFAALSEDAYLHGETGGVSIRPTAAGLERAAATFRIT